MLTFSWDIHHKCNYRCSYCWFDGRWVEEGRKDLNLSVDEWELSWNKVYDKYKEVLIEIVGGEPFIYPSFFELIKKLSKKHCISICTNLFFNPKIFFSKKLDSERVSLNATFHPLYQDLETFLGKAKILKNEGFLNDIHFVAYPPVIDRLSSIKERFEEKGILFDMQPFWGELGGKVYPDSYSEKEKRILNALLKDDDSMNYRVNRNSPRSKLCNAGYQYAYIKNDGIVTRCGRDYILGNIVNANFRLLEEPRPCLNDYCPCSDFRFIVEEESIKSD